MKVTEIITKFKVKSFLVEDLEEYLSESIIIEYYQDIGYDVLKNYATDIKQFYKLYKKNDLRILGIKDIPKEAIKLFTKEKSGFPDLLLIKDGLISFVEIKINRDGLSYGQESFINQLSLFYDVTVVKFYAEDQKSKETQFERFVRKCKTEVKNRKYNKYYIIARTYANFEKRTFDNKNLSDLSRISQISQKSILWYLRNNGEMILKQKKEQQDKFYNSKKNQRRLKKIENTKRQIS